MALEYKMISPASESDEEKLDRLTNELISMEEHYKLQDDAGASDEKLTILEENILAKRTEFEAAGGTYPEL